MQIGVINRKGFLSKTRDKKATKETEIHERIITPTKV